MSEASDLPEQRDPADGRQWTLTCSKWGIAWIEPAMSQRVGESVVVVPLERAQRAEAEVERIKSEAHRVESGVIIRSWGEDIALRERAEGAARAFAEALDRCADEWPRPNWVDALLASHPGFLPNYPGENG